MDEIWAVAEAIGDAATAFDISEELQGFYGQVQEVQGDLSENLQATVGDAVDTQHEAIKQNAEASRAAYQNDKITWEEHQANIDRNAELLRQVDAGSNEMVEGATQAAQANIVGEAVVTGVQTLSTAAGAGIAGEVLVPEQFSD